MTNRTFLTHLVSASLLFAGATHAAPQRAATSGPVAVRYEARVLGSSAWGLAIPHDVNNLGVVVGDLDSGTTFGSPRHAVVWADGRTIDLTPNPAVVSASAQAINDDGVVTGYYNTDGSYYSGGFRWKDGEFEVLPTFAPGFQGGHGINESGTIVGRAMHPNFRIRPTAWDAELNAVDLGSLGTGTDLAHDINRWGVVVGASDVDEVETHAFLWSDGRMRDLGTLPGKPISRAHAINDRGEVVGFSGSAFDENAIYWSHRTGLIELETLGFAPRASANDINESGTVVGFSYGSQGPTAVVWNQFRIQALEDLLVDGKDWRLFDAAAINDLGQIAGHGFYQGQPVAFLLTPVLETESR